MKSELLFGKDTHPTNKILQQTHSHTHTQTHTHSRTEQLLLVIVHFGLIPHTGRKQEEVIVTEKFKMLFVGCFMSQQHASVSHGRTCSDNFTCCYTEIEVAGQTFHLTQSQFTDTGPTSPSTDPITPGAWQGSHWSANF